MTFDMASAVNVKWDLCRYQSANTGEQWSCSVDGLQTRQARREFFLYRKEPTFPFV